MFWADMTKYVRSVLFKNELSNGDFKVKQASEDEDGTNIAERFGEVKNYINNLAETLIIASRGSASGYGNSTSSITPSGYPAQIIIQVEGIKRGYHRAIVGLYNGFNAKPTATVLDGRITITGYSDEAHAQCSAAVTYELNLDEFV